MKAIAIAAIGWAACLFALGLLARVMWWIFMLGWGVI